MDTEIKAPKGQRHQNDFECEKAALFSSERVENTRILIQDPTFDLRAGRAILRQPRFFPVTEEGPGFPSDVIASERLFPIIPRTLLVGL